MPLRMVRPDTTACTPAPTCSTRSASAPSRTVSSRLAPMITRSLSISSSPPVSTIVPAGTRMRVAGIGRRDDRAYLVGGAAVAHVPDGVDVGCRGLRHQQRSRGRGRGKGKSGLRCRVSGGHGRLLSKRGRMIARPSDGGGASGQAPDQPRAGSIGVADRTDAVPTSRSSLPDGGAVCGILFPDPLYPVYCLLSTTVYLLNSVLPTAPSSRRSRLPAAERGARAGRPPPEALHSAPAARPVAAPARGCSARSSESPVAEFRQRTRP